MYRLRFRQVHLDFHTSPHIEGIGEKFDRKKWQEALKLGHVNSITCFSKCHHGWSYHPTKVGRMHPHLKFDLLRAQIEASKEIGVNVPIYISAGVDNLMAEEHPEWREISIEGAFQGWTGPINRPGFKTMCFNTPYLDYLCEQIREAVEMFPECDGVFLDIIHQGPCCCKWCLDYMFRHDLDPDNPEDRQKCAQEALMRYYKEATAACRSLRPDMPVFHNSGHIPKGKREILQFFSHLELESLPTGGWGYDHFPMSAKYCQHTGLDYLGMTGKFHTTWGEFGGYKHPNALRYECAAMLAHGSKCSVGDQLHPSGEMDPTTYAIIGAAYEEVEKKEPWCDNVTSIADIAVLSSEAETGDRNPDTGAGRVLFEEHFLFDLIDRKVDFANYKMLILPDVIRIDEELKHRLDSYLENGGKLLLTGRSGLRTDESGFAIDIGAEYFGESPFQPDYIDFCDSPNQQTKAGVSALAPWFVRSPLVMYMKSQQIKATTGEALAWIRQPYFNRTWKHFCSHQHAPAADLTGYVAAVRKQNVTYLAHPIFSIYCAQGAVAYKQYASNAIRQLLGDDITLTTNLPSTARVTLMEQEGENRYVLHLLYAGTIARGAQVNLSPEGYVRNSNRIEVLEELIPLHDVEVTLKLPRTIKRTLLQPQGQEITFEAENNKLKIKIDKFTCHQMVVLEY
ncbi:MAG: beta-galactosidase trimerization domain-containing protein [Armatimonadota bacterium]